MEKKVILVGMLGRSTAFNFMNIVLDSLAASSVDIIYIDHNRIRFKTDHTEVRFIYPVADRIVSIDGIRADAIFGQLFTEMLMHAKEDAVIAYRDKIGLVDYICQVEREASESRKALELGKAFHEGFRAGINGYTVADMYPPSLFITMPPRNGRSLYKRMLNYAYGKFPAIPDQLELYAALTKGEINMAEHNIHIQSDPYGLAALAKNAGRILSEYNNRHKLPGIKNVIYSGPCTIVLWEDGTKTVVRCNNDVLDPEKGLAMAIAKKAFGTNKSGSNYYDIFKKWLPKEEE